MELSPELDLLEQLTGRAMPLSTASTLFRSLDRFRRVIEIYVRSGAARLVTGADDTERVIRPWELRVLLDDPTLWAEHRLQLTDDGYKQFAADGQRFFDWLFRPDGTA